MVVKIILLLTLSLLPLSSAAASTCGCGALPESTPEQFTVAVTQAYDRAASVFSAIVVGIEYRALNETDSENAEAEKVKVIRFRVDRWWKGEESDEVILYTNEMRYADGNGSSNSCEYNFEAGKMYVVYAYQSKKKWWQTDNCSRTKPTEYAEKEMVELGEIKARKVRASEGA